MIKSHTSRVELLAIIAMSETRGKKQRVGRRRKNATDLAAKQAAETDAALRLRRDLQEAVELNGSA